MPTTLSPRANSTPAHLENRRAQSTRRPCIAWKNRLWSPARRVFRSVLAVSVALVVLSMTTVATTAQESDVGKPQSNETERLESFIIQLSENTDLTRAYTISDPYERTAFVVEHLRATAEVSQAEVKAQLDEGGYHYESLWLSNDIWVRAPRSAMTPISKLEGVSRILVEPETRESTDVGDPVAHTDPGPTWNVEMVGAPALWAAGITGQGTVIASLDTGIDANHPALAGAWRHEGGWIDTTNANHCDEPCDNVGHGSHTSGIMVGSEANGVEVGVAPDAKLIAARVCDDGCHLSEVARGMQWLLAPTNAAGEIDPRLRPDVINASWSREKLDVTLSEALSVFDAAGIEVVFAVGNSGPSCGSNSAPGEMSEVFAVANIDRNGTIAASSSRGPTSHGGTNPQIAAPGQEILSVRTGGGYMMLSGTSMAAPHVTASIALLLSAHPELRGSGLMRGILERSAQPVIDNSCGPAPDAIPNNVYGSGRLDLPAALALSAQLVP